MSAARQLSRHLKELRIHLCQTSSASAGAREFINTNYITLKTANPEFPILVRECSGIQVNSFKVSDTSKSFFINKKIQPRVIGRYAYGREEKIVLADMSASEVDQAIASLANGPSN